MSSPTTALTEQESQELREVLLRLRAENETDLRRAQSDIDELSSNGLLVDPSMREVGTSAEYFVKDATSILAKIDTALAAMDAGTYGGCASCGKPIPLGRLRIRPYEPKCVACSQ